MNTYFQVLQQSRVLRPIVIYLLIYFFLEFYANMWYFQAGPKSPGTFKLEGLTPKKKYKIRVKAVNKEGESEPLETDQPIVAKNPYGK